MPPSVEIAKNDVASFASARYGMILFHTIWILPFRGIVINAPLDIDESESAIRQIVVQESSRVHFVRG